MMEKQVEITKERKAEIGNIIFQKVIQTSDLNELTIQEVLFSIRIMNTIMKSPALIIMNPITKYLKIL